MNTLEQYDRYAQAGHDIFATICSLSEGNIELLTKLADVHSDIEKEKIEIYKKVVSEFK